MGNCCPKASEEQVVLTSGGKRVQTFQGQGQRLGTGDEAKYKDQVTGASESSQRRKMDDDNDDAPAAAMDPNLTPEERAQIRAERAKAAEARLKKLGVPSPAKKKTPSDAPLVGPNSKPAMTWTL